MPGGPRGALVDEVNGDSICDQIPLPHGHRSVNFRFSMIPSSFKFQVRRTARALEKIVWPIASLSGKQQNAFPLSGLVLELVVCDLGSLFNGEVEIACNRGIGGALGQSLVLELLLHDTPILVR